MRRPKAPVSRYVTSPHNYAGGKARLLHKILPDLGDQSQHTFIDLFAGGLNVGMNAGARHTVFNDALPDAMSVARYLSHSTPGQVLLEARKIADSYGLSNSVVNGYDFYNTDSSRGLAQANREQFLALRQDINLCKFSGRDSQAAEFVLVMHAFNCYMQRSAKTGLWTSPVGKRDLNTKVIERTQKTVDRLQSMDHSIVSMDFEQIDAASYDNPFVYLDPPYSIGAAPYNAKWTTEDDARLLNYIDSLSRAGIPWAMSNVMSLKGQSNQRLAEWSEQYQVIDMDFDYRNSSYRRRDKGEKAVGEALILNV